MGSALPHRHHLLLVRSLTHPSHCIECSGYAGGVAPRWQQHAGAAVQCAAGRARFAPPPCKQSVAGSWATGLHAAHRAQNSVSQSAAVAAAAAAAATAWYSSFCAVRGWMFKVSASLGWALGREEGLAAQPLIVPDRGACSRPPRLSVRRGRGSNLEKCGQRKTIASQPPAWCCGPPAFCNGSIWLRTPS
jgi:hypothetical protein